MSADQPNIAGSDLSRAPSDEVRARIALELREVKQLNSWTSSELADHLDYSPSTVSGWLNGKSPFSRSAAARLDFLQAGRRGTNFSDLLNAYQAAIHREQGFRGDRKRLYLGVGVSEYSSPAFASLRAPVDDVSAVGQVLREVGYGATVLGNPSEAEVEDFFETLTAKLVDDLVIYWSGHAVPSGEDSSLVLSDSQPDLSMRWTPETLMEAAELSGAGQILIVLDTSFHGGVTVNRQETDERWNRANAAMPHWIGLCRVSTPDAPGSTEGFAGRLVRLLRDGPKDPETRKLWNAAGGGLRGDDLLDALRGEAPSAGQQFGSIHQGHAAPLFPNPVADPHSSVATGRDHVDWVTDAPAALDLLNRRPLARMLATRLERLAHSEDASSFLVHLDGPWGIGKSSIFNFLRDELEAADDPWIVVEFNAWRQADMGPAWWTLMTALRKRVAEDLRVGARLRLALADVWQRARATGAPYALALITVFIVALAGVFAIGPGNLTLENSAGAAKSIAGITAVLGSIWAAALVAGRFLLWESAAGAHYFERSARNPTGYLRDHFAWLVQRRKRPVVFLIDDLDRCPAKYVVELLDGIQSLMRDPGENPLERGADRAKEPYCGPYFVVAGDGGWLRGSYEQEYGENAMVAVGPGQTLGHLFLDKLFQLSVTVPRLSSEGQRAYLEGLLDSEIGVEDGGSEEAARARVEIERGKTHSEIQAAWASARPEIRDAVASVAVDRLTDPTVVERTEHELQKFGVLLDQNPRRMKRFLNSYAVALVTAGLEQSFPDPDTLALWTVMRTRWPTIAEDLEANPEAVEGADNPADIQRVIAFEHGGPLTREAILNVTGRGDGSQ